MGIQSTENQTGQAHKWGPEVTGTDAMLSFPSGGFFGQSLEVLDGISTYELEKYYNKRSGLAYLLLLAGKLSLGILRHY
jgi:hypothetical protein